MSRLLVATALATALGAVCAGTALGAPASFWTQEVSKSTPPLRARGVATVPESAPNRGHVVVADSGGNRIVEYTAWGQLSRVVGWDVVESGPGDTPGGEFEICEREADDECKVGARGSGVGQLNRPGGVAIDPLGDVYVIDFFNLRVQKFDPDGDFLLMFGDEVNKTTGADVCTKADAEGGDTCGAGKEGQAGEGQFFWPVPGNFIAIDTSETTTDADDTVYIGDKSRIQVFDAEGEYQREIALPEETAQSLAADASGDLYVTFSGKEDARKLDPETGEELLRFEAVSPTAIAVAADGDVYVHDEDIGKILHFGESGEEVEDSFGDEDESTGLAVSSACGIEGTDVFATSPGSAIKKPPSFVRAYGPPPDPDIEGCEQPAVAPQVIAQYAASVGTDDATVRASINPSFWQDATYYVEYGAEDCEAGPCKRVLFPGAPLTDEVTNEPVAAAATLSGLAPGKTYHFRFIAKSGGGGPSIGPDTTFITYRAPADVTSCPNQALRSGPSAALPDCRAYEMVSPVDKNGGDVIAGTYEGLDPALSFSGFDQATPAGARLAYTASTPFAEPEGASAISQYIAEREGSGWRTRSIDPPLEGGAANGPVGVSSQFKAFSDDLCAGWLVAEGSEPLSAGPEFGYRNLYRRANCGPTPEYTWSESSGRPEPEPCVDPEDPQCSPLLFPDLQGTSADGRCAAFRVNDTLTPDAPKGASTGSTATQLYVWCEDTGMRLASVLPSGEPFAEGSSSAGTETISVGESSGEGHTDTVERALSEDGSLLYWTASGEAHPKLYLRVNPSEAPEEECADPSKACTLQVSPAGFLEDNEAQFWSASKDGRRAIFSIVAGFDEGDIYEYSFDPETGSDERTKIAGESLGVAGASEDATRVYLASEEVCSGANGEGKSPSEGEANLYLHEPGEECSKGDLDFIGTLAEEDRSTEISSTGNPPSPLTPRPRRHIARASADGAHLAFVSAAQLTDYDNIDRASGKADREVYLYDADEGELRCASCNPTGARPAGADLLKESRADSLWTAAWIPGYQQQLYGRRLLSADGSRVYFNAIDSLALRDTNGAQDVYEWQEPGSGACTTSSPTYSARNEGCVELISTGKDSGDSEFVEASADGSDVFFRTEESLVSSDPGSIDIYDARAGGGFPDSGGQQTECEGEGCQSPAPAPQYTAPSSLGFTGPGDLAEAAASPCAKPARRAAGLSRRAKRLRRNARRSSPAAKSRRLRAKSRRLARRAKAQSNRAKRCRRARRAGR